MKVYVVCVNDEYIDVFGNYEDAKNLIFNQLKYDYGYVALEKVCITEDYCWDWIGINECHNMKTNFSIYVKEI